MRALVPWFAVFPTTVAVHLVGGLADWSQAEIYVALVVVGFPVTMLTTAWADGGVAGRRRGDDHPPHVG